MAAVRKIAGHRVKLSHYPYLCDPEGDHTPESRFEEWRLPDSGQFQMHGHTHSKVQVRGRLLHVGLDAHNLRPVKHEWAENIIGSAAGDL